MKAQLLQKLKQRTGYISGEALSKELGVSRTSIWKYIKKLRDEGYEIESVSSKGYILREETSELIEEAIRLNLGTNSRFKQIQIYDSIDSTNNEAKRLKVNGLMQEGLIIALEQTAGKGRRGRTWVSQKDVGIWMSILLQPEIEPNCASMLTLVAGLSVAMAIREVTQLEALIKWPNDVVINGKKVAGILTEMSAEMDYINHVIVGIGINVNHSVFEDDLKEMATSLKLQSGTEVNKLKVLSSMLRFFESYYEEFIRDKTLDSMIKAYNGLCVNVGKELSVIEKESKRTVYGVEVASDGALIVKNQDNTLSKIHAGEVSVRGLYGYI
jgi:BirA family biotin operon repressor/biotin-[acetyl-CoA-carboxylase] ligase